jgi:hypothetical protein
MSPVAHTRNQPARSRNVERGPVRFSRRRGPTRDPCCAAARARTPAPVTSPRPGWCDQPATRAMSGQGPSLLVPPGSAARRGSSASGAPCRRAPGPDARAVVRMPGPHCDAGAGLVNACGGRARRHAGEARAQCVVPSLAQKIDARESRRASASRPRLRSVSCSTHLVSVADR